MSATPVGVGIDLVDVRRMAESLEQFGERFLHRVFTPGEIAYATSAPAQAPARLAARFAAKEATLKAMNLGDRPLNWTEIEVHRLPTGQCEIVLHGGTRQAALDHGIGQFAVSLSHEGSYATAVVVSHRSEQRKT